MIDWHTVIGQEKQQVYFREILAVIKAARQAGKPIYPAESEVFNAFRYTPFDRIKVVILGQDPYHGPHQAHGLCFSVPVNVAPPPSLVNIYKELAHDLPTFQKPDSGCLQSWAEQGVLLLNAVLTVEAGRAHSHAHLGWQRFTDRVISAINQYRHGIVFLLWGAYAQKKWAMIDRARHTVLVAAHPSPLSAHRGFFGSHHFSKTNQHLQAQGCSPIDWQPR